MDESDRTGISRVERISGQRSVAVREQPGVAHIDTGLPVEFRPEPDGVEQRPGEGLVGEVGLVDQVVAIGGVLVRGAIERGVGGVHRRSRIDVLVEFLEVGVHRRILHGQSVFEVVIDHGHGGRRVDAGDIVDRAAEEGRQVAVRCEGRRRIEARCAAGNAGNSLRWVATVGGALVVEILVAQLDAGGVVRLQRHRRIDAIAFELAEVAEGVRSLVERIDPGRDMLVDGLAGIERDAPVAEGAGLRGRFIDAGAVGLLQRAVDETAAGGAAEGEGARPFQDFNVLGVVEITEVLDVVAEAVDVEVGAGIDAANDQLVAVAFALVHRDAGNVAGDVGDALGVLILNELLGQHADRLRDVQQRRVALGRTRGCLLYTSRCV